MYKTFQTHFQLFVTKHPELVENTLSNIFTMRLIGNKTHGDMAEVGISEFISQFMYNYDSKHVGKDKFRAKEHEEDIIIIDELSKIEIPVSLKAYGDGPLQLSTDKQALMFPTLLCVGKQDINNPDEIQSILSSEAFAGFSSTNVMPLIYREDKMDCNIMVFDFERALSDIERILFIPEGYTYDTEIGQIVTDKHRTHPIFVFLNSNGNYICEVRYGGRTANALQRGLWTNTKKATPYFNSLTNGWIPYSHNQELVKLIRLALNASKEGHVAANVILQEDIDRLFTNK